MPLKCLKSSFLENIKKLLEDLFGLDKNVSTADRILKDKLRGIKRMPISDRVIESQKIRLLDIDILLSTAPSIHSTTLRSTENVVDGGGDERNEVILL